MRFDVICVAVLFLSSVGTQRTFCQETSSSLNELPRGAATWVFLGDSNTFAGRYVGLLDAQLHKQLGPTAPRIINLGVSSETASGLSEPDHPFPRPCVHSRLEKTLAVMRPQVVFACYGINDGIYAPTSKEVIEEYKFGIVRLVEQVKAAGAAIVLLTPPPFEADALRAKGKPFGPAANGKYAWFAPAANYDDVVKQMSDFLQTGQTGADYVVDIRGPLLSFRQDMLATDPGFLLTSDGVHFEDGAHTALAHLLTRELGLAITTLNDEEESYTLRRTAALRDAYLSACGKNRPGLPAGLPPYTVESKFARLPIVAK